MRERTDARSGLAAAPALPMIPFNRPCIVGRELEYIRQAVESGRIAGNGEFTGRCHRFFAERYGFRRCVLTSSCTDALEMAAILCDVGPGDEIVMPSYTFVSTANAFVLRGAHVVFADSGSELPNIDEDGIEHLITERTKVIVVVHYAGIACDMSKVMQVARRHSLLVVEDAAHAVDAYYDGRPLGGIGHFGAFSFHESKNVVSGEGGMLTINDERFFGRAETVSEKGTNRAAYFRGELDKYSWVDLGSSFLPSEITAAFLYGQLEQIDRVQLRRREIWRKYDEAFRELEAEGKVGLAHIPPYARDNGHLFYLVCRSAGERSQLIAFLRERNVHAVFHYLALHESPYYAPRHDGRRLEHCRRYSECLLRLPLFFELSDDGIQRVITAVREFYGR